MLKNLGIYYLIYGIRMLRYGEIRKFLLIPLGINVLVFALATFFVIRWGGELKEYMDFEMPYWLSFLQYLIIPLLLLIFMVISYYLFATVAGVLAAPFNGPLAAKADELIQKRTILEESLTATVRDVPRIIAHTLRLLMYTLPRMLFSLLFLLIPIVGYVLWLLSTGWIIAIGYLDCSGDNHQKPIRDLVESMKSDKIRCIGFGISVYFMMLIPVVNLFVIPAAVCGSTKLLTDLDGGMIMGRKKIFAEEISREERAAGGELSGETDNVSENGQTKNPAPGQDS
ncbi:MAG: sulfate transporter CysZ [Succinivibrionaceae bacterium]|nr:sulfate transporter CysZ [Succinivibrionaceae bacterium]